MSISQLENLSKDFTEGIDLEHSSKKTFAKSLLNNAGILVGVFILFAVIIIVTTDIKLANPEEIAKLGIDFFLLLFCSYSMYINCSDSGMRFGMQNENYLNGIKDFEQEKTYIISCKNQKRLHEFCRAFIQRELENTRTNILAIVGFDYEKYVDKWLVMSKKQIKEDTTLTGPQKKAIIKANSIRPIRLTPEMIMKRGGHGGKRSPLGMNPNQKKVINFSFKLITNLVTALFWTAMVVELAITPTWQLFVAIVLRSLLVVLNGYSGYKFGYENIVYDTVNYMKAQTDLMIQATQYFEEIQAEK